MPRACLAYGDQDEMGNPGSDSTLDQLPIAFPINQARGGSPTGGETVNRGDDGSNALHCRIHSPRIANITFNPFNRLGQMLCAARLPGQNAQPDLLSLAEAGNDFAAQSAGAAGN
jgi:hypothetical protein